MPDDSSRGREEIPPPSALGGIALLYVEDEADARVMVTKMLGMNYPNLTIYHADNGVSGLELYRQRRPDIVMTDINMPVMDGIRMSREIRSLNPEVHIIAVTAHSDTSYLLSAIEIGVHNYVLKPLNYQELFTVIDKVLEQVTLKRLVGEQHLRITESEKQLAGAQRIARLGSWEWHVDSGGMKWSDELYRICDLDPGSVTPDYQRFLELFAVEERPVIEGLMHNALKGEAQEDHRFCRVLRPDGSRRIVRVEAGLLPEERGHKTTVIGTCHDVTELKEAEEQVRLLTEDLERRVSQRTSLLQATVSELETFSYFVSHDLRAPVARLEGYCKALLEDCVDSDRGNCRQYAERAEHVTQQIKQIIDAFNRLTHYARCALVIGETDLSGLVRVVAAELQRREPQRRVDVLVAPGIRVRGDAELLRTAVKELLKNAWKFTSKTEHGRIEFGRRESEGVSVYYVRDNGAGFNMKYADKLFKPFQTIHTPGEFDWNGAGIGLATVHSIILRHGGEVWAEGEVGRGATFSFTLEANPESGNYLTEGLCSREQRD